ncbi:hypothetical protein C2E23DRAFT_806382 [Lenzites betulinus]|nr:hypothetical protein C2E23DRAFT_806382 [Lenzites betulinus]
MRLSSSYARIRTPFISLARGWADALHDRPLPRPQPGTTKGQPSAAPPRAPWFTLVAKPVSATLFPSTLSARRPAVPESSSVGASLSPPCDSRSAPLHALRSGRTSLRAQSAILSVRPRVVAVRGKSPSVVPFHATHTPLPTSPHGPSWHIRILGPSPLMYPSVPTPPLAD